jgi:5,10-methylenetetrahydromethanopterin reductase
MKFSVGHLPVGSLPDFVSLARCAEKLDFDIFFIADHATKQNPYAMLSVAALKTKRISLATGVTNPFSRNPLLTAAAISTIDSISDGRAILGIGAGGHGVSPFNQERPAPISTLKTSIETIRTLLNSDMVSDPTGTFNLINAKLEFKPQHDIPIYVAGRGKKLLELAGAVADGAIAGAGLTSVEAMKYALAHIRSGAESTGRKLSDLDIVCWSFLSIGRDKQSALDAVIPFTVQLVQHAVPRSTLESFGSSSQAIDSVLGIQDIPSHSLSSLRKKVSMEIVELFAIAGTPEQCLTHISALHEIGISHCALLPFENAENTQIENLELFYDMVISEL